MLARTLRHFFPDLLLRLGQVADFRNPLRIVYPVPAILMTAVLMGVLRLQSRRQINFQLNTDEGPENLNRLAGTQVRRVPDHGSVAYFLRGAEEVELRLLRRWLIERLLRSKVLDRWRVEGRVLVAVDGTGLLLFSQRHCPHCLTQTQGEKTVYYHMALEAKIVTSSRLALSIETEFIENSAPNPTKQDCERNAFYRMSPRLKEAFPHLRICLLLDGEYLCQRVLDICRSNGWDYIITFKEGSMPAVWGEYERLRELCPQNRRVEVPSEGVRQELAWVEGVELTGGHRAQVVECVETTPKSVTRFAYAASFRVDADRVVALANDGRLRWKIENQGFNTQKNHGYNLEHAYIEDWKGAKNIYLVLQIAHLLAQLMEHGSLLSKTIGGAIAKVYGSVKTFVERLRESFRTQVIGWEWVRPGEEDRIQIRLATSADSS